MVKSIALTNAAAVVLWALPSPAFAQASTQHPFPKNWTYEVDSRGNRVAKVSRVATPDGGWREEIRQGNCLTIRERSGTGEYKETTQCSRPRGG